MSADRLRLAEELLREVVFDARARQAAGASLLDNPSKCGLGDGPELEIELSPRGKELAHELWPRPLAPTELTAIQKTTQGWIERQDALDRKRNHFLRDFRQTHGFDRRDYGPEVAEAFEGGLERINVENEERLREAARELLGSVQEAPLP